jgi:hypothetical protein
MSVASPVNICPRCEAEYRVTVDSCADCDVSLVRKATFERAFEPLPFSDDLVAIRTELTSMIKHLAEALAKAGIRCHVGFERAHHEAGTVEGSARYYHILYVRPEHEEDARRVERHLLGEADEEDVEEDAHICPACGAPRSNGGEECPDCGLFLGMPAS